MKVGAKIICPPKVNTKMLTKEKVNKKPCNAHKFIIMTTRVLKGRKLKVFGTTAERRAISPSFIG